MGTTRFGCGKELHLSINFILQNTSPHAHVKPDNGNKGQQHMPETHIMDVE